MERYTKKPANRDKPQDKDKFKPKKFTKDSYLKNKWPHNSTYWSEIHYSYGERYKNQSDALWDDQNIIAKVSQLC